MSDGYWSYIIKLEALTVFLALSLKLCHYMRLGFDQKLTEDQNQPITQEASLNGGFNCTFSMYFHAEVSNDGILGC